MSQNDLVLSHSGTMRLSLNGDDDFEPHPLWRAARNANFLMAKEILKNLKGKSKKKARIQAN